ncbi:MAG: carbohydrate kinase family protein [Hyphomicrobium sp.]|nr:carbohydrate kinase family protein [Hyphomicrobium sp.]
MIDTIAVVEPDQIGRIKGDAAGQTFLMLEEGRKFVASRVTAHVGGGGVNTAVCLQRLGFSVHCVVKLGRDDRSILVRATLAREGVSDEFIREHPERATGASVIVSAQDNNAAILTYRGANSELRANDLPIPTWSPDIVYIAGLSDESAELLPALIERYAVPGSSVSVNPGIRQLTERIGDLTRAFVGVKNLFVNVDEAFVLVRRLMRLQPSPTDAARQVASTPVGELMRRGFASDGHHMSLPHFFECLLATGPDCIVVTDGARGAYTATRSEMTFCSALQVPVAGTAGAGDAFNATFAARRWRGETLEQALRAATLNASSVIGHADTLSGLLTQQQLDAATKMPTTSMETHSWQF